ncbi:MAG: VOC family protein [Streptosporangiaceae bacterium]|jgi:catechol 2,3-dioxygenase-like lactoylglutathione lyase family enzyme
MAGSTPHRHGVAFGRIAGAIPVNDISQALSFYQDILGMSVTFANGEPTGLVILERDAAELHLTLVKGHKGGSHNAAHLMVADAAGLHDHLVSNGVRIIKGLRDADYGLHGFVFADPTATASTSANSYRPVMSGQRTRLTLATAPVPRAVPPHPAVFPALAVTAADPAPPSRDRRRGAGRPSRSGWARG